MADAKISALPSASTIGGTEILPGVQSGGNVGITPNQLKTFMSAMSTLTLGGATIGPNALAVTGSVAISSTLTVTGFISSSAGVSAGAAASIFWNGRGILSSPAAGSVRFGSLDAASPVAQTVGAQGVVVGTANTNAPAITWQSPQSTGTGTPGGHVFQSTPAGSSGSSQNPFVTSAIIGGPTYHVSVAAGTTARSQINFAAGVAPTSPQNGDVWFDGTNLKMQIGGVTKTFTLT